VLGSTFTKKKKKKKKKKLHASQKKIGSCPKENFEEVSAKGDETRI
jgi:hypothetical protein